MPGEWIPAAGPNFMVGRSGRKISQVVLHTTVGTMPATIATFQNPGRIASAHYVVGLDGRVVNMVRESDTAFHSGNWEENLISIGIEHVDDGDFNGPRTPQLYAASIALVGDLCQRYAIPRDRAHIRKHSEVSDSPTACPDALAVDRIVAGAALFGGGGGELNQEDNDMYFPRDPGSQKIYAVYEQNGHMVKRALTQADWPVYAATGANFHDVTDAGVLAKLLALPDAAAGGAGAAVDLKPVLDAIAAIKPGAVDLAPVLAAVAKVQAKLDKDLA